MGRHGARRDLHVWSHRPVYSGSSRLDVFCRGTDRALYQRAWFAGVGWLPGWFYVGGIVTSDPDAASPGGGSFPEVFVRGTDDAAYQLYWDGAQWVVVYLGGVCTSGPSATYSGPTRLDVFCRGTDMAIWHLYWLRQSGWSGWERISGAVISDPEATSPGPGGLPQVFARGLDRRVQQFSVERLGLDVHELGHPVTGAVSTAPLRRRSLGRPCPLGR